MISPRGYSMANVVRWRVRSRLSKAAAPMRVRSWLRCIRTPVVPIVLVLLALQEQGNRRW